MSGPDSGRGCARRYRMVLRQLRALGYEQFGTQAIKLHPKNVPLYDLMLASRRPRAKQLCAESQKPGPGGQYRLPR